MITDLTFGTVRPLTLQVHPFVPLNHDSTLLAVSPHFPLNSKPDENILRVCSYARREVYDAASLKKEGASRDELIALLPATLWAKGPISLPSPVPDIDLLIRDDGASTIFVCELKWIRKPTMALEHLSRDSDFLKGIQQLKSIRTFLTQNAQYIKSVGLASSFVTYDICYVLIARDHFKWVDPDDGIVLVDFDAFKNVISTASTLKSAMRQLLKFAWLPEEERDFVVRMEYAVSNGVFIESENFYSPSGANRPFPILR